MAKEKNSFVFHLEWTDILADYPDDVRHEVYDAVVAYAKSGEVCALNPLAKMAFSFIKKDMDNDKARYEQVCNTNKNNGLKGGRPKNRTVFEETEKTERFSEKPKKPDNDYDYDYDGEYDGDNEKEKNKKNLVLKEKPSIADVATYAASIGSFINVQDFMNYYDATDWHVGNKPMKNWKLCVQTWTKKDKVDRPWLYAVETKREGEIWQQV